jgi:hypothetical protein
MNGLSSYWDTTILGQGPQEDQTGLVCFYLDSKATLPHKAGLKTLTYCLQLLNLHTRIQENFLQVSMR